MNPPFQWDHNREFTLFIDWNREKERAIHFLKNYKILQDLYVDILSTPQAPYQFLTEETKVKVMYRYKRSRSDEEMYELNKILFSNEARPLIEDGVITFRNYRYASGFHRVYQSSQELAEKARRLVVILGKIEPYSYKDHKDYLRLILNAFMNEVCNQGRTRSLLFPERHSDQKTEALNFHKVFGPTYLYLLLYPDAQLHIHGDSLSAVHPVNQVYKYYKRRIELECDKHRRIQLATIQGAVSNSMDPRKIYALIDVFEKEVWRHSPSHVRELANMMVYSFITN